MLHHILKPTKDHILLHIEMFRKINSSFSKSKDDQSRLISSELQVIVIAFMIKYNIKQEHVIIKKINK